MVGRGLESPSSALEAIAVSEHYARAAWIDAPLDSDFNAAIRLSGEELAADGPQALADRVRLVVEEQRNALAAADSGHRVAVPSGEWSLVLDDLLLTRLMEIAVHSDDLAVSAGVDAPPLSEDAVLPVLSLLAQVALRRHGQRAMLRALTRRERAPSTITAF
jgi:hypothetical protein